MSARARTERGAALLVAIVSIAVLTALAVNLAYESRVSLRIAANARDELRASYLARSGVTLSRLVLSFQQDLNDVTQPAAAAGAAGPAGAGIPRIQLWRLLPVGSELARALFPAAARRPGEPAAEGGFEASIDDEGRKVNAQLDISVQMSAAASAAAQVQALYQVICDPKWDPLFEREDASGVRTSREDLLVRLRDWVDEDERGASLRAAFGGASCGLVADAQRGPFEDGYGDENQPYDRGEDRYKVKNARMDSLDELFLVAGVGDAFMAAFGDGLTVYLPREAKRNVNELDRTRLVQLAMLVASPPGQPALFDPVFAERLQKLVLERTLGGILAISPQELGTLIGAAGVTVNQNLLLPSNPNTPFTNQSNTFRVRATGKAGDVAATIDAVVRTEKATPGKPVATPGKLIHWKEG
jgi:general secretion pathway protein K